MVIQHNICIIYNHSNTYPSVGKITKLFNEDFSQHLRICNHQACTQWVKMAVL